MAKNEVKTVYGNARILDRYEPKIEEHILLGGAKEEAAQYNSNAITDRWFLTLSTLANMDLAEIMNIGAGLNELTKLRNSTTRQILLVADQIGLIYPNFITKIFPKGNISNIYYKFKDLKDLGIIYPVKYKEVVGEKRETMNTILRYMIMKGNVVPRQMTNKPDLCEISPAWKSIIQKTIKPNETEKKTLKRWKLRFSKIE